MPNSYTYVDPDYIYTDPQTGVLRNIGNIADNEVLQFAETGATALRSQELWVNPIPITSSEAVFSIHHYLFQDIYEWAGQKRTVEISSVRNIFAAFITQLQIPYLWGSNKEA